MSKVLVTMPGRYGDILWSLPTARELAKLEGEPVDFAVAHEHGQIVEIIQQQDYINKAFVIESWCRSPGSSAAMPPPPPASSYPGYDEVYHLGYKDWPRLPLILEHATEAGIVVDMEELWKPWIKVPPTVCPFDLAVGFTDEYFELKFGLCALVHQATELTGSVLAAPGSRWELEGERKPCSLVGAAQTIQASTLFLGDLSALAVLAAGIGKPRVLMEPQSARHHEIFQHWDTELVVGNDGKPTFDARHTADAVKEKMKTARY